jgi:hypothetical protein
VATITQSVLSTQYLQVLVAVTSIAPYSPTSDTVAFAFTNADAYPPAAPSAWNAGSWQTGPGPQYWAQILIGPANGGLALAAGAWQVWLKVTDSPEVPVLQPCILQVT